MKLSFVRNLLLACAAIAALFSTRETFAISRLGTTMAPLLSR